ncbi:hypothetical protein IWX48DRAFT_590391 [Phyllosticta citricarpa]
MLEGGLLKLQNPWEISLRHWSWFRLMSRFSIAKTRKQRRRTTGSRKRMGRKKKKKEEEEEEEGGGGGKGEGEVGDEGTEGGEGEEEGVGDEVEEGEGGEEEERKKDQIKFQKALRQYLESLDFSLDKSLDAVARDGNRLSQNVS